MVGTDVGKCWRRRNGKNGHRERPEEKGWNDRRKTPEKTGKKGGTGRRRRKERKGERGKRKMKGVIKGKARD